VNHPAVPIRAESPSRRSLYLKVKLGDSAWRLRGNVLDYDARRDGRDEPDSRILVAIE
jgi:hypothetical protein